MTNDNTVSSSEPTTTSINPEPTSDDDDEGYADPQDARVSRDSNGEKIPKDHEVTGVGLHQFLPMAYGDVQQYLGDGSQHEVEEEALARLFEKFILKPDYASDADEWAADMNKKPRGRITSEYIEDMKPLTVRGILMGLFEVSGIDADVAMDGTKANVDVDEGNQ